MLSTLLLLTLLAPAPAAPATQEETPPPVQDPEPARDETPAERAKRLREAREAHERAVREHQWTDADGNPIQPGVLPAKTTPEAAEAWRRVTGATGFTGELAGFDLRFHLILRQKELDNELDARLSFLKPNYVRAELGSGRSQLRGPEGDFLIDGDEVVRLVGREGAEDKKQLDRTAALARNFLGLVDPTELRILDLALLDAPPAGLPEDMKLRTVSGHAGDGNAAQLGAGLKWLSLRSPDFELESASPDGAPLVRSCLIGFHPETFDVELAVLQRDRDAKPRVAVDRAARDTLVVVMGRHQLRESDGVRVPRWIGVFDVVDPLTGAFRERPASELILTDDGSGGFRTALAPTDFLPPATAR